MKKIGLLSDTHGFMDPGLFTHFASCDELWHAGDIGSIEVLEQLESFKPTRLVFGNIDGYEIRRRSVEDLFFEVEGFRVWITHIGGYPPNYNPRIRKMLKEEAPHIFICGHSHILRVMRDQARNNMWYLNPGAAGREGFHKVCTALRFVLDNGSIRDMELIDLGKRGRLSEEMTV